VLKIVQIVICIGLLLGFNTYVLMQKDNDKVKQIYIDAWEDIKNDE